MHTMAYFIDSGLEHVEHVRQSDDLQDLAEDIVHSHCDADRETYPMDRTAKLIN